VSRSLRATSKHCLVQRYDPIRNHGTALSTGKKQIFRDSLVFIIAREHANIALTCLACHEMFHSNQIYFENEIFSFFSYLMMNSGYNECCARVHVTLMKEKKGFFRGKI
jgi:hypothetical protein